MRIGSLPALVMFRLLSSIGLLFLATRPVAAQIDTGAIVGTVRDASGAAVPKAAIDLTNSATGLKKSTVTNDAGEYQFTALPPGNYSVRATAPGFGPQAENNIEIHVQSRPSVDFSLKVGNLTETVEVASSGAILQTQSADVGGVVQEKQIKDLPLNGRRYADLALLEPGIQKNVTNPNNQAPDRFSSNGNLETQNYFSLDGVDNNSGSTNLQEGSVQTVQPPPDALQEFRVQTRTYSAEFGTSAGAVINASIKSGTNGLHGDVWEFIRNNKFDSNTYFNNAGGVPRGHFSQNQFGGTIGGPIIKNRTFFFFDAQDFTSRKATTVNSTVPTPLMKQGNFTELKTPVANPTVPSQNGCIAGNIIAASCIDPVGSRLLALYPNPNIPAAIARQGVAGSWTGAPNYQFQYSVPNDTYSWDTRIDHNFTPNNRIFGRFSDYTVDRQDPPWTSDPIAGNGNFATQYRIRGKSVAAAWTDLLKPSMLNELRAGFSRDYAHSDPIGLTLATSQASDYGLAGIPAGPNDAGIPPINISGLQRLGSSPWRPQFQVSQVWQLLDTLSWLKGNHSFRLGYEHRHTSDNFLDIQSLQGQITASGIYSGNSGLGVPDFLLGDISTAAFTTPTVVHNYQDSNNFFAQDIWRVNTRLTLTFGLRYELFSPILNHQNALSNFTPANGGGFITAQSGDWYARGLVHPDKNDFAPRVGFSWQPKERIVLRGGYGVFYQHVVRIGSESMLALNPPWVIDGSLSQTLGSTTPAFLLRNGFPAAQFTPALVDLTKLQVRAQDPNERTGYVSQVSFGPQFEISKDTVLDISYVGNFGRKMNRLRNANQGFVTGFDATGKPITAFPYPNLNTTLNSTAGNHAFLELATNDGNTNYNGLLASLRRRFASRLSYGISYTWSHNFSDYVDNLTGGSTPATAYNYSLERSNSPFDVTHRFVANAVWDLPIGKGGVLLNNNGVASRVIGGWQLNSIVTMETGTPFTVTAPDVSQTGGSHQSRASCIGDPWVGATSDRSQFVGTGATGFFLNPAAFAMPATGTFGTCAPRAFHGPGIQNLDLSLFKRFAIRESWNVEFRSEFFNALNHANFNNPSASIAASSLGSFGRSFSTVTDPREIQFALKLYF
ncbi:MAG: TonB-dependent receptor [Acidobacteriia bacterium]|nr:TonB-dependent receptor [Terriglobia bacterium]